MTPTRLKLRTTLVLIIQVGGAGLKFASQIEFAHLATAASFGLFALGSAIVQIVALPSTGGFNLAVIQFVPRYVGAGDWRLVRILVRRATFVTVALSGAVSAALLVAALISSIRGGSAGVLLAGAAILPPIALVALNREILRAVGRVVQAYLFADVLSPILAMLIAAVLWLSSSRDLPATALMAVTGAGFVIVLLMQVSVLYRCVPRGDGSRTDGKEDHREWLGAVRGLFFITVITTLFSQVDILSVGLFRSTKDAAHYAAANKLSLLASFFLLAVASVFAPIISEAWSNRDRLEIVRLHALATRLAFLPTVGVAMLALAAPGSLLSVFGPHYSAGSSALRLLIIAQVLSAATGPIGYLLIVTGDQTVVLRSFVWACAVDLVGQATLTPVYGPTGAALATLLTMVSWNLPLFGVARSRFEARFAGFL